MLAQAAVIWRFNWGGFTFKITQVDCWQALIPQWLETSFPSRGISIVCPNVPTIWQLASQSGPRKKQNPKWKVQSFITYCQKWHTIQSAIVVWSNCTNSGTVQEEPYKSVDTRSRGQRLATPEQSLWKYIENICMILVANHVSKSRRHKMLVLSMVR